VAGLAAALAAFAGLAGLGGACRETTPSPVPPADRPVTETSRTSLSEVLRRRAPELMALPGVVGVAEARLADGSPCLRVYVERMTPELERALPGSLDGWPVEVEVSGAFRALDDTTGGGGGAP
jgi:hypothetical protein